VASAASLAESQEVRILQEDPDGLLLAFSAPLPEFVPEPRQPGRVVPVLPGAVILDEPGLPRLPYARALIGVPEGMRPLLVAVHAPATRLRGQTPAVTVRPFFGFTEEEGWEPPLSPPLPAGAFPKRPAEVTWVGWLREVQVAEIRFYPVRGAGEAGDLLFHPRIEARIDFLEKPERDAVEDRRMAGRESAGRSAFRRLQRRAILNSGSILRAPGDGSGGAGPPATDPEAMAMGGSTPAPLKIAVDHVGLYKITPADLSGVGMDPLSVDPREFRLEFRGAPLPVEVVGESDGVFDPSDYLVFFGQGATGRFTRENVYWLHFDGSPSRVATRGGTFGAPAPAPASFATTLHREEEWIYTQITPATATDKWWWKLQIAGGGSSDWEYSVEIPNLDPAVHTVAVRVNLQGRTSISSINPDHHTRIFLNGVEIDDQTWDGQVPFTHDVSVSSSLLAGGSNTVRILMVGDTGAFADHVYVNYIEIDYQRTYQVVADVLLADGEGTGDLRFALPGFTTPDPLLYDATDPNGLARISVPPGQITGTGPYTLEFQDNLTADKLYAAATPAALAAPVSVVQDVPSSLHSTSNGADYIAIVPSDPAFTAALQPLLDLRAAQGHRVLMATTEDIYDEFNFGIFDPAAIETFTDYAYGNYVAPPPLFLLLAGDAHIDYLDNFGSGLPQYVPAKLIEIPGFGETPSDNEYATTAGGDYFPELYSARLPARSAAELTSMVNDILAYENSPPVSQLNAQSLFVADDDDVSFEATLSSFASVIPPTMAANEIYLSQVGGASAARAAIRAGIDAGALMTTYLGHGSVTQWAGECIWGSTGSTCGANDPNSLLPTDNTSFFVALNCINGYFTDLAAAGPGHVDFSLAEAMVRVPNRGAIAMWAPTALGTLADYSSIGDWLFRGIFLDRDRVIGGTVVNATIAAITQPFSPASITNIRILTLFGDPATNLALDSDGDGLSDLEEEAAGMNPLDGDSDDDGLMDGLEADFAGDVDGDGVINGLDPDADDDGLFDGTEMGVTVAPPGTNPAAGFFVADADPNTVTDPLDTDSDAGGVADGAEDRDFDGALDTGETDPTAGNGGDDPVCGSALPEIASLANAASGDDVNLTWDGIESTHPCTLYRVYAAADVPVPKNSFVPFSVLAVTSAPAYTHAGVATDGISHDYLVVAFDPVNGEGPLGHYGQ
jgi:hypothetical protein